MQNALAAARARAVPCLAASACSPTTTRALLCHPRLGRNATADRDRVRGDLCTHLCTVMRYESLRMLCRTQRGRARARLEHLLERPARGGVLPQRGGQRLRAGQRQHRSKRRGDRRRLWRRERHRRWSRSRLAMHGSRTCAERPTRSTTQRSCRSPKVWSSCDHAHTQRQRIKGRRRHRPG